MFAELQSNKVKTKGSSGIDPAFALPAMSAISGQAFSPGPIVAYNPMLSANAAAKIICILVAEHMIVSWVQPILPHAVLRSSAGPLQDPL